MSADGADIRLTDGEVLGDTAVEALEPEYSEAERFARELVRRSASRSGVRIDRAAFFRTELPKYNAEIDVDEAIDGNPIAAGMTAEQIDRAARDVIEFETKKCSALSFAAGLPGGLALAGTVPADLVQYFAHVLRVEQKLAYLYGWQTFLNEDDEIADDTVFELVLLMGVMLGVGGASASLAKFAVEVTMPAIEKRIARQALTKTAWYPVMKKVLGAIGVQVTKGTFAKAASKVVPVVGGVVSGGMTYASFKPGAERLRKHLRALPLSGISPDSADVGRDGFSEFLIKASDDANRTASAAAGVVSEAGTAVARGARTAGTAVAGAASQAGVAAAGAAAAAGETVSQAARAARGFLDSLGKRS